ncbi:MAG: hypothetical protein IPP15_19795 [Saprospiraceae bacterium]|uniref:Uncharacterized protein n=1 Tax=Candidatus Opimibacter skivensis TaxID=2982028 RepID=A0A9D7SYK1_9BACT|nr:hypothetical protein [Candidatus Opimibacter skivensis]
MDLENGDFILLSNGGVEVVYRSEIFRRQTPCPEVAAYIYSLSEIISYTLSKDKPSLKRLPCDSIYRMTQKLLHD